MVIFIIYGNNVLVTLSFVKTKKTIGGLNR